MAYSAQTSFDLKSRYPEFSEVDEALVELVLSEAERETNAQWTEADRAPAVLALTAHWLSAQGVLRTTNVQQGGDGSLVIDGVPVTGPIKARTVGDVRTEFAEARSSSSGGSFISVGVPYKSTIYGQRWLELAARNAAAGGTSSNTFMLLRY